jgi:alkylated DNA nucleotide flippase Atl1
VIFHGEWTTYGELAMAATGGRLARQVGHLAANHPDFENAHRVLGAGGVVRRSDGDRVDAVRSRRHLESEGVVFQRDRADPAHHVGWIELRGRLQELLHP